MGDEAVDAADVRGKEDPDHEEERAHYLEVRYAFVEYSVYMEEEVQRIEDHYANLPLSSRQMLSSSMTSRYGILHTLAELLYRKLHLFSAQNIAQRIYGVYSMNADHEF